MSKRPSGFDTQEEYNAYMRRYKRKRRIEAQINKRADEEVKLLLSNIKYSLITDLHVSW